MPVSSELREKREQIVTEHLESENTHDYDVTMGTFHRPRYELVGTGEVFDGRDEVARYFEQSRRAFPDQRNQVLAMHHSDRSVIVEAVVRATHRGPLRSLPPTGRRYELPILAIFVFDEDRLLCERVYFDSNTMMRQLGIARDPLSLCGRVATLFNHPVAIWRGLVRQYAGI